LKMNAFRIYFDFFTLEYYDSIFKLSNFQIIKLDLW
jgi:hypothetical protein